MKKNRQFLAVLLIVLMVFANIGSEVAVAFSKTEKTVVFELDRDDFAEAVKAAAKDSVELGDVDFEITDGSAELFWTLFAEDGGMYEAEPEIRGGADKAELRVFVRLPEADGEDYSFTGQEEVYFLFINHSAETVTCVLRISGKEDGDTYTIETAPLELPCYTAAFGDNGDDGDSGISGEAAGSLATPTDAGDMQKPVTATLADAEAIQRPVTATLADAETIQKSVTATPADAEASPSDAEENPATASDADPERLEWEASDLIGIEESSTARLCMTELDKLASVGTEDTVYEYETEELLVRAVFTGMVSIPENAQLSIETITQESDPERYAVRCAQFVEAWGGDGSALELYDIGFYAEDGSHIDVSDRAAVSVQFKNAPLQIEGGLAVIHFAEEEPKLLEIVELDTDEENQVRSVTFDTTGFSDFAISRNGIFPQTGGTGTAPYTLTGILFMASAVLLYELRYKRTADSGSLYRFKVKREGGRTAP